MPRTKAQSRRFRSGPSRPLNTSKREGTRAPNAFFVYRGEQWAKLKDEPTYSCMQQPEFLKMIAKNWQEVKLDPTSYAGYQEKARRERDRRDRILAEENIENERIPLGEVPYQQEGDAPSNAHVNQGGVPDVPYGMRFTRLIHFEDLRDLREFYERMITTYTRAQTRSEIPGQIDRQASNLGLVFTVVGCPPRPGVGHLYLDCGQFPDSAIRRRLATSSHHAEDLNVAHSRFLAEAPAQASWKGSANTIDGIMNGNGEDVDSRLVKVCPDLVLWLLLANACPRETFPDFISLFKLILPVDLIHSETSKANHSDRKVEESSPPTAFLPHPSQPLSHISRLIISALSPTLFSNRSGEPSVDVPFRSATAKGNPYRWSDSTDMGDFIRDAAKAAEFRIHVTVREYTEGLRSTEKRERDRTITLPIELKGMEELKKECDREAHRGARRMAVGGFGMLVVYWGTVARLTFWDYGWDVMEPITYLSGLSTVILGYLWFLYQGRELSYSSILDRSISARRQALFTSKGLDIERWMELVNERKVLRREIENIRGEYEGRHESESDKKKQEKDSNSVSEEEE
ncbi:hypothetical protein NLI96_g5319 [Meripilus lineatus]|uniref:Calcium uniporter protein, mitochondrial n=1 Tax=Meripilus lineatus TaxID=2056292 RepID=A0AAD5V300_9APHY|nr:hypothetical protein NLI96_g5319 [Physisporinus lineatus]